MDLLLRGARVVDGTGSPAVAVDVAVTAGSIIAVGPDLAARATDTSEIVDLVLRRHNGHPEVRG